MMIQSETRMSMGTAGISFYFLFSFIYNKPAHYCVYSRKAINSFHAILHFPSD
jgi:hypothetical protein